MKIKITIELEAEVPESFNIAGEYDVVVDPKMLTTIPLGLFDDIKWTAQRLIDVEEI